MVAILLLAANLAAMHPLDDFHWREECRDAKLWTAQPSWLSNGDSSASVACDGDGIVFRVTEPSRGMKWSLDTPAVSLDATPWLVIRYRAESLNRESTDYLIYANDDVPERQLNAIRLCDANADGEGHVAAVDLSLLTESDAIRGLAVQVQARPQTGAALCLDWIALTDRPADGAEIIRRTPAVEPKPEWVAPLSESSWEAHSDWLANPAADGEHAVRRRG